MRLIAALAAASLLHAQDPVKPTPKPPAAETKPAASPSPQATPAAPPTPSPADDERTLYALGHSMYGSLQALGLTPAEFETVRAGLTDAAAGKPLEGGMETYGPRIQALRQARFARRVEQEKTRSTAFVEAAAKEPGAVRTESGLVFFELKAGEGPAPAATDKVKVHYRGTLIDGTEFDNSMKRGAPAEFALNAVIKCWTEGVQKMRVGGRAKLVCPSSIAYGDRGRPSIPGGAALIFEVDLVEVVPKPSPAPAPPATPAPPGAPPAGGAVVGAPTGTPPAASPPPQKAAPPKPAAPKPSPAPTPTPRSEGS